MKVFRSPHNPVIQPENIKPSGNGLEVIGVFNAGVTRFKDEIILLLRVAERPISKNPDLELTALYNVDTNNIVIKEFSKKDPGIDFSDPRMITTPTGKYLTSLSHLRIARSKNGLKFEIDEHCAIKPETNYETFGLEDPRISLIDQIYYVTYVAVSPLGVTTCLASTKDFKSFQRHGVIFCPDNKDVVLLPKRIDGRYYALHRPVSSLFEKYEIWLAESTDLKCWGNHRYVMGPRKGSWDDKKVGASTVPLKIEQGWLEIYHGADKNNRYCMGAVLLDSKKPWKVIARTEKPILEPQADYEINGFFGNTVFSCGLLYEGNKLRIYYGAADTSVAYAEVSLEDCLESLNF